MNQLIKLNTVFRNVAEALARTKPTSKENAGGGGKSGKKEAIGQDGHVTYELFANPDQSQNGQQTKAVELDARLAKLEQALGADPAKLVSQKISRAFFEI